MLETVICEKGQSGVFNQYFPIFFSICLIGMTKNKVGYQVRNKKIPPSYSENRFQVISFAQ